MYDFKKTDEVRCIKGDSPVPGVTDGRIETGKVYTVLRGPLAEPGGGKALILIVADDNKAGYYEAERFEPANLQDLRNGIG